MNLGQLTAYIGNLLDYDPTNSTYSEQLADIVNEAQTRVLTDRAWDFAQKQQTLKVYTDETHSVNLTNGNTAVSGTSFPINSSTIKPGSYWDGAVLRVSVGGTNVDRRIAFVENATTLHLFEPFEGTTATYTATIRHREVYLPSDTMTVMNVGDPTQGASQKAVFLSRFIREDYDLDSDDLGSIEGWTPGEGLTVPAPRIPTGVAVTTPGAGHGVRTIKVYMVNVLFPDGANINNYRGDASGGFESALSQVGTYALTDTEELTFTPETLPDATGLYRRFYFTCEEAGIKAPLRIRDDGTGNLNQDTIGPPGGVTITADTNLTTLQTQAFRSYAIRYKWNHQGIYQTVSLYPHPSATQEVNVRVLVNPEKLVEDQDTPLIPASYAQVIAYAALEQLILKVDNPALASVYERKHLTTYRSMESRFLGKPARRIIKGSPAASGRYFPNPYGPLTYTP